MRERSEYAPPNPKMKQGGLNLEPQAEMIPSLKKVIKKLPIAFTKNQRYDKQTIRVIRRVCKRDSNCIDAGCHKGEVLDIMLKYAPLGKHYGFEPVPSLYEHLAAKYAGAHCIISALALSNRQGAASFNYVTTNPSYSGLIKRKYDRADEADTLIEVKTDRLDNVLPPGERVDLMKIDVEGGELLVLEGAAETLKKHQPVVIFEHGLGASEFYNSTPARVFDLLHDCGLQVSLMKNWLSGERSLTKKEMEEQFYKKLNYYFIAYKTGRVSGDGGRG